jgi:O-antigen ligase
LPGLLRRVPLERAIQIAVAATIVTTLLSAGSLVGWIDVARRVRWVALFAVVALAAAYAARRGGTLSWRAPYVFAAGLVAFALLSATWSSDPTLSAGRAISFGLVIFVAAALAYAATDAGEFVLEAVVLGAVAVAVGGLLVLAFRYDRAVQAATTVSPARYQGLGGGPNMAPMVLAIAVPIAFHLALARRSLVRAAGAAGVALLLGSIAFSGSRGAFAASFAGLAVYALARRSVRVGALAAVLAAVTLAVAQLPQTAESNPPEPTGQDPFPAQVTPAPGYLDANVSGPRLQDDIGHPGVGVGDTERRERTLTGSSGRTEAWRGTLGLAADRPLVGYGFGTEDRTFVDRYVFFNSSVPENSYLGILLQLGVVGLVLVLALAVVVLRPALATRSATTAAAAAAFAAALVLALFQSYVYAAGNVATLAAWLCGFAVLATRSRA